MEAVVMTLWLHVADLAPGSPKSSGFCYDLDVRDYNLWAREQMPIILILYDANRRQALWLCIQQYFRDNGRRPIKGTKKIRVWFDQRWNRRAVAAIRRLRGDAAKEG